ncbi:hypothetical protein [Micromonospora parathelypteridis]|uniref:Uncharacterized protein n=1 Tax=Micromonospora parathelypteridis TaxID=1839617 RepID=A0A840VKH6_9ACTN|nr:hypothetical protein [Micromonospora parathelypteridis]MBB5476396.1 hypothetical protein [Micromonospora parathelypteridis]
MLVIEVPDGQHPFDNLSTARNPRRPVLAARDAVQDLLNAG